MCTEYCVDLKCACGSGSGHTGKAELRLWVKNSSKHLKIANKKYEFVLHACRVSTPADHLLRKIDVAIDFPLSVI